MKTVKTLLKEIRNTSPIENLEAIVGKQLGRRIKALMDAAEAADNCRGLDLADAQFIGYSHGRFEDLIGMVIAMGLTKQEWEKWKGEYITTSLRGAEIAEIDNYFKELPK